MKKVTYIEHSSYLIECDTCYLLFDYYKGEIPKLKDKKIYVFASHKHADHYQPRILNMLDEYENVKIILSNDIQAPKHSNVISVAPNTKMELDDLQITTLTSTDAGVAFLIQVEGMFIYHAGDLNWWHWAEENSEQENSEAKDAYLSEIAKLKNIPIDIAFVVLDPRQEEQFHFGMQAFLEGVQVEKVFPMHFWGDYGVVKRFHEVVQKPEYKDIIIIIDHCGEEFDL